ncbi:helix-turn-helix domain-containing protein [Iodobacter ciconiae]|uniref:helix-turn-helix domain-containing protein n=1 Tax=Iodobacter ciconiae TaxID=2496266 RepID=UPI0019CFBF61|nr:AraC family transcriptional regulator [Iodobacter ciconiae]
MADLPYCGNQQACGITLKQYLQKLKLDLAHRMLKDGHHSIECIIEHCGFASPQAFRAAWWRKWKPFLLLYGENGKSTIAPNSRSVDVYFMAWPGIKQTLARTCRIRAWAN